MIKIIPFLLLNALATSALIGVPTNVALNKSTTVSSTFSSAYPGANAVDGNNTDDSSRWLSSGDASLPQWIEIDLENTYSISQFKFKTGKNGVGPFPLYDFALQQWNGSTWTNIHSVTGSTNTGEVDESFTPIVSSNRIRLNITSAEDNIIRLFELEVYGEEPPLAYTSLIPTPDEINYNPANDIVLTFNSTISAVDLSGIRVRNLTSSSDLSGTSITINSAQLLISHGGLTPDQSYSVHVPEGSIELASDPTATNASIYWEFDTATADPQLLSYSQEVKVTSDPVIMEFDREINITNSSGIFIRRASDNSLVTGVAPSVVNGTTLSIAHDTFPADETFTVQINANSIEGVINNTGNEEIRRVVFSGSIDLINATFDNDAEGFQFAKDLISTAGTENWWVKWGRTTSGVGPDQDSNYLVARTNWNKDFVLSPQVSLDEGLTYTLKMKIQVERPLRVGLTTSSTPDISTTDVLELTSFNTSGTKTFAFSPDTTDNYYLVFYHGDVQANQDMAMDSITLTRAIEPIVRIMTPLDGSSHLESDSIPVTIEAFGVAGPISSLKLYDDSLPEGTLLGTPSENGEIFSYTWDYHVAGTRNLSAVAIDSFGNTRTDSIEVTINFEDGSLPNFIGYDFDFGWDGWTRFADGGTQGFLVTDNGIQNGQAIRINEQASERLAVSSPGINLFHGETYTLSFKTQSNDGTNSYEWAWLIDELSGYPTDSTDMTKFTVTPTGWVEHEYTFTVPYDGAYHLTFFRPSQSGYQKIWLDDIRIIGNTNAAPFVNLDYPDSKVTTVQGVDMTLSAAASDADGGIDRVEFYRDAFKIGEDNTEPYSLDWENLPFGTHNVFARAVDVNGAYTDSGSIVVEVEENGWSIATLLGKASDTDEAFTGAGYLSDGTLVVGGIMDPTLFPGVTPVYLNGRSAGDRGFVALLSEDGTTVQQVVVVGDRVLDLDIGGGDRIYVAASGAGAVVLNSAADTVLWSQDYADLTHRIDAAENGTFVVLNSSKYDYMDERISSSTNYVYDTNYNQLGSMGGATAYTTDVAIDSASQTVCFIGWKNIAQMEGPDGDTTINPVDIPAYKAYAYDGTLKYRGYDWEALAGENRFLNLITNNMADTRGSRIHAGNDGYFYMGIEFDGGNTPLRYDPFDVTLAVQNKIIGGPPSGNHGMANTTTAPKVFVGRYTTDTGEIVSGQWITNRLSNGNDNTIRIRNGNITTDDAGRIHVVGFSASGLPITMDHIPNGVYEGGNFHLVYSPDFSADELIVRYSYGGGQSGLPGGLYSNNFAVAISPNGKAFSGGFVSRETFTYNAFQSDLSVGDKSPDAYYTVADLSPYYSFQTGAHPRLFFDESEVAALRAKVAKEPYLSMKNRMITMLDLDDSFNPYDPTDIKEVAVRAHQEAFLYIITGDESYAEAAKANVEKVIDNTSIPWADSSIRGLDSYWFASKIAMAYDWCVNSDAWDSAFDFKVSNALLDIGNMIIDDGGSEQSPSAASNWQGSRGASGVLALLATDHNINSSRIDSGYNRVIAYLNGNLGSSSTTRGWNPEGQGYTYFPNGNYVGPFGIAMARHDPSKDIRDHVGLRMSYWSIFAGATSAVDVYNFGGVKPDWSDDNAHIRGEGTYNQSFYYAYDNLKPGLLHMYDRLMGFGSDDVDDSAQKRWDSTRGGAIWGILYYPQDLDSQNPSEIWDWHQASNDSGGIGMFTFRDAYVGDNDFLAQFKARLRNVEDFAHDAPDGLGFRIIGNGTPWVVGGGRNTPGRDIGQASLYTSVPDAANPPTIFLNNTGSLVGTPLITPDGGGHVIASMAKTNVGVNNHKRWFVANYDSASTGVDAAYVIADTSDDGVYWQIPTFAQNTVTIDGNTFTITGSNGSTLKGTVLTPTSGLTLSTGTMQRGSAYSMTLGGSLATGDTRVDDNKFIRINHSSGDFLVVLTVQSSGDSHPTPLLNSGTIADANISIGALDLTLQNDNILYNGSVYTVPDATVTFDAGAGGSITSGNSLQTIAYGEAATEPTLSVNSGFTFVRWDKAFDSVTKSMTVNAVYYDETSNNPPVVDASEDFSVEVLANHTIAAAVTDDGLPNPRGFTTEKWTQVSGPGTATFDNDSVTNTTVSFDLTGTYVLRLTSSDGVSQGSDDVTVTVNPIAGPGQVRFVADSYSVSESGGTITVEVERYNGGEGAISIDYATGDSSAVSGSDYETTTGTLLWGDGEFDKKSITITINEDVSVEGNEIVVVTLSNPTGGASIGTTPLTGITITDNDVNSPPSITFLDPTGSAVAVAVNTPLTLNVAISDDGQPSPVVLTWTKVSGPGVATFGSNTAAETTVSFSAMGDYVIKAEASDGSETVSKTMGILVNSDGSGSNTYAPVAGTDSATLDEDTFALIDFLANDSDADPEQTISMTEFTQPANGTVSLEGNNFLYIPNVGFTGIDSFTYTISDGIDTSLGQVNLTVLDIAEDAYIDFDKALIVDYEDPDPASGGAIETLVNYPFNNSGAADRSPGTQATGVTASNVTLQGLTEDTSRSGTLGLKNMANSFARYFAFTLAGDNGTDIDLNGGSVGMFVKRWNGGDKTIRVSLIANGVTIDLSEATTGDQLTYTSEAISGLPVANSIEIRVYAKTTETWSDTSIDNLQISGSIISAPPSGNLASEDTGATLLMDGNGWYSLSKSYTATIYTHLQFDFKADPQGEVHAIGIGDGSTTSTIFQLYGSQALAGMNTDYSDYSGSEPNYKSYSIPVGDYQTGEIQAIIMANDDDDDSAADAWFRNVRLVEVGVNNAPFAENDSASGDEDAGDITVSVLANDTDSDTEDTLTITEFSQGNNGSVTQVGDDLVYSPAAKFNGSDSFTYTITDGLETDTATVSITINPINDAPVATDDSVNANEDSDPITIFVLSNDFDIDSAITIDSFTQGVNGSVSQSGNNLLYTPVANFNGNDSFTYTITDGSLTDTATVSITINAINDSPLASNDTGTTDEDTDLPINVLANDTDVEEDALSITSFTQGSNGSVSEVADDLVYSPSPNFFGSDSFSYTISDGATTDTATVEITINPINDAPVAVNDSATGDEDGGAIIISVLSNDSDIDSSISIDSFTQGTNGSVSQSGSDLLYTPNANFNGSDSFTYVITDGFLTDTATVTLTITAQEPTPFETWVSGAEWSIPSNQQGLMDDPDSDGLNNRLEFVSHLHPMQYNAISPLKIEVTSTEIIYTYQITNSPTGFTIVPAHNSDMSTSTWTPIPNSSINISSEETDFTIYEATLPISANPTFFQLLMTEE